MLTDFFMDILLDEINFEFMDFSVKHTVRKYCEEFDLLLGCKIFHNKYYFDSLAML